MNLKSTLILFFMICASGIIAQVTTAGITGVVRNVGGEAAIGATVKLLHVPSGTVYGTVVSDNGRYTIANARVGGPYTLEVSSIGQETFVSEGIYLTLGDVLVNNVTLADNTTLLNELLVTSGRNPIINGDRTGASTNIDKSSIERLPTLNRSITDFTRLTPQAFGNSFAGRDGRMNNLQIDGANLNNAFGLSGDPLPGGGNQPISLDAIEEIQVNVAPYDVRQTGFTGAGINAVTRGGTNELSGSVYSYFRPKTFTGVNVADFELDREARATTNIYGARLGGPIIKNKLLYFVNFEWENRETGGNPWLADNGSNTGEPNVARTTVADLTRVSNFLRSEYNYNPGAYENYANTYNNQNIKGLARLDWNINNNHTFTARYSYMEGNNDQGANASSGPNPRSSSARISDNSITFENGNYAFTNKVSSVAAELNSRFGNNISNQLLATYSRIQDTRSTPGSLFPFVDIWDGHLQEDNVGRTNYMSFGTELFSFNNDVINNNIIITDNLTLTSGINTITAGVSYQYMEFANSFQRLGSSYYRYNSVDDFINKAAPSAYGVTYVYDGQDNYARVKFGLAGLYIQDKLSLTDRFNVTVGVRADMAIFNDSPPSNPSVDDLDFLDADGNVTKYTTAQWPKSVPLISPRVGFNLDALGDRTLQIRGGTGIFTGNIPFVYFTNMPTNAGVLQNTFEPVSASVLTKITEFNADPKYWPSVLKDDFPSTPSANPPGGLALIDPDFKMPQIWRTNLGLDYKVPGTRLIASADLMYTKDIVGVYQHNINRKPATEKLTNGGDTRDYWGGSSNAKYNTHPNLNNIVPLLTNHNEGSAFNATLGLNLLNLSGLNAGLFYSYTASEDITGNPGSSANSVWSNNYSINDPNERLLGYSQYAVPHRVLGNLTYRIEYGGHFATTIGLYYNGSHGGRFAWTYGGDVNADGVSLDLLYVPNSGSEINFVDLTVRISGQDVVYSPAQQAAAYDAFIATVPELEAAKGSYIKRNAGLMPWNNRFDFKINQDFFIGGDNGSKKHTLQVGLDIFNVANLINSNWGIFQQLNGGSGFNYALLNVANNSTSTPTFRLATVNNQLITTHLRNNNSIASTWGAQLGVRYFF